MQRQNIFMSMHTRAASEMMLSNIDVWLSCKWIATVTQVSAAPQGRAELQERYNPEL